jgi:hypothetical protein
LLRAFRFASFCNFREKADFSIFGRVRLTLTLTRLATYLQDKSDVTLIRVKKSLQIRIKIVNDEFVDADDSRDDANVSAKSPLLDSSCLKSFSAKDCGSRSMSIAVKLITSRF